MIVDTSAIIAMIRREAEKELFYDLIIAAKPPRISAATYFEAATVLDSVRDPSVSRSLDEMIRNGGIEIMPVTVRQAHLAREAYRDFGKGSGHKARLNFGDCFSYALAKDLDEPLLFKGDDFLHTDVRPAR